MFVCDPLNATSLYMEDKVIGIQARIATTDHRRVVDVADDPEDDD